MSLEILENTISRPYNYIIYDAHGNKVLFNCFVCLQPRDSNTWRHVCRKCGTNTTIDKMACWYAAIKIFPDLQGI